MAAALENSGADAVVIAMEPRGGRERVLQVIGAGFGRTGTFTLKKALERLGFDPCYHMVEVFGQPTHDGLWMQAADGRLDDWEQIFSGYHATVDWPGCAFYASLMERYPEAKVILTVRDPESWYKSAAATILHRAADDSPGGGMRRRIVWDGAFSGRFADRDHAIAVFERHNDEVRRRVPTDRLLVYEVREGWAPLARFLGVDAPADPFPHLNTTDDFRNRRLDIPGRGH